ncbi:hypothetical protein GCM10010357_49230 [Streptomyces luteireticuli]|uniref:Uncharacterized protein n=1 Tax=Streptomyces luteireticuli TaxID=173858 RepID=A0ABN0YZ85_9ACTN
MTVRHALRIAGKWLLRRRIGVRLRFEPEQRSANEEPSYGLDGHPSQSLAPALGLHALTRHTKPR